MDTVACRAAGKIAKKRPSIWKVSIGFSQAFKTSLAYSRICCSLARPRKIPRFANSPLDCNNFWNAMRSTVAKKFRSSALDMVITSGLSGSCVSGAGVFAGCVMGFACVTGAGLAACFVVSWAGFSGTFADCMVPFSVACAGFAGSFLDCGAVSCGFGAGAGVFTAGFAWFLALGAAGSGFSGLTGFGGSFGAAFSSHPVDTDCFILFSCPQSISSFEFIISCFFCLDLIICTVTARI